MDGMDEWLTDFEDMLAAIGVVSVAMTFTGLSMTAIGIMKSMSLSVTCLGILGATVFFISRVRVKIHKNRTTIHTLNDNV